MIGIELFGYGKMGKVIEGIIEESDNLVMAGIHGIDMDEERNIACDRHVVIDFSHKDFHDKAVAYALENGYALVSGTTNLSEEQMEALKEAGRIIPVCYSTNYSYGVLALKRILRAAAELLGDWDIELTETHHNQKVDAPSGTAKSALEVLVDVTGKRPVMDRTGKREADEIGVHALRGGTIAGIHTVDFFGREESITITHNAQSRRIFAEGAVKTAANMTAEPGFYTVDDIL